MLSFGAASAGANTADPPDLTGLTLEQLADVDIVYAASKRTQTARTAPSFVSIVTANEIRQYGHRTLADVLRSLPGFYVTDDRNYSYVGVRGFDRPGDYSTRILVLLDGLRTNNNVYDQAFVGHEFPVDVALIERIEVVRGPGGAMHGNNALFAVVNVITRRAHDLSGGEVVASAGAFGTWSGRATWGRELDNGWGLLGSSTIYDSAGESLYFPEFDALETNRGLTSGTDGEHAVQWLASATKGRFTFQAARGSRRKGFPTGSYDTTFADPRNETEDTTTLLSARQEASFGPHLATEARLHYGRYDYAGTYVYGSTLNLDHARGDWWGFDWNATWSKPARHLVTFGGEFQDNRRQNQSNGDLGAIEPQLDARHQSKRWGLYVQDELKVASGLTIHGGVRLDYNETFGHHTSPRLGAIWSANPSTTVKLLYGTAFRAPNEYELHYDVSNYELNPDLGPETIRTSELVLERFFGQNVKLTGSAFLNRIEGLISLSTRSGLFRFENAGNTRAKGTELMLEAKARNGFRTQLSYSLQKTTDDASGLELTNSPRHMVKLNLGAPLGRTLSSGLEAQYVSSRSTLQGGQAKGFLLANATVVASRLFGGLDATAGVYNLFDRRYGDPGSDEHVQDTIPQPRRSFRLQLTLHVR